MSEQNNERTKNDSNDPSDPSSYLFDVNYYKPIAQ